MNSPLMPTYNTQKELLGGQTAGALFLYQRQPFFFFRYKWGALGSEETPRPTRINQ
jgi:hypothetical protein